MTDRHCGYIVTLADERREDDAEVTLSAIQQIKGVIDVRPLVADPMYHLARQQAKSEMQQRIWDALKRDP